jgi:hypothetical protein
MHFALVCRPDAEDVYASPENAGYTFPAILRELARRGEAGHSYAVIDTTNLSDDQRAQLYIGTAVVAAGNRYRVARVFGSNRHPGQDFGWRVPALLVYAAKADTYPVDVYPHEFKDGRIETIASLLASDQPVAAE